MTDAEKIIDQIEQKIGQSEGHRAELKKEIQSDVRAVDDYIDRRIEQLGNQIRSEVAQSMEAYREEMIELNGCLRMYIIYTWAGIASVVILYLVRSVLM